MVDWQDFSGWTSLHLAAEAGNAEATKFLLRKGADPNRADDRMSTALHRAARFGACGALRELLARHEGGDVVTTTNVEARDALGRTPVFVSASRGHVGFLNRLVELVPSVRLDTASSSGRTPLTEAGRTGRTEIVCALVRLHNIDVDARDKINKTALDHAAFAGHLETVELLVKLGADVNHKNNISAYVANFALIATHERSYVRRCTLSPRTFIRRYTHPRTTFTPMRARTRYTGRRSSKPSWEDTSTSCAHFSRPGRR